MLLGERRGSRASRGIVAVEVGLREQHAAQQQRGVDGGQLAVARRARRCPCRGSGRRSPCGRSCPRAAAPCGALSKKRSVASVRSTACSRVIQPRSTPMPYAVRPKPTAAMLEKDLRRPAIGHQPVGRIAQFPEVIEGAPLEVVEQRRQRRPFDRRDRRGRRRRNGTARSATGGLATAHAPAAHGQRAMPARLRQVPACIVQLLAIPAPSGRERR